MTEQTKILVRVSTFLVTDPETVEMEKIINYADPSDRTWLGKHSWWAFHNGRGVEQEPLS